MKEIPAIILSAGRSSRMGFLKPLLLFKDKTLLEHQLELLRDCGFSPVIAVLGHRHKDITKIIEPLAFVINKNYNLGQFSSIKCGLKSLKKKNAGALILPVDCPFIKGSIIERILKRARTTKAEAIIPVYGKIKGHPIWISQKVIAQILKTNAKTGRLDKILEGLKEIKFIKTTSKSILNNINTKNDWLRLLNGDRNKERHPILPLF